MAYTNKNIKTDLDTIKKVGQEFMDKKVKPNFARQDGYYGKMTVGSAENLVGRGVVGAEYNGVRTSAGTEDIGSGSATITKIKGRSLKWNQIMGYITRSTTNVITSHGTFTEDDETITYTCTSDFSDTARVFCVVGNKTSLINGHKYLVVVECNTNLSSGSIDYRYRKGQSTYDSCILYGNANTWLRKSFILTATGDFYLDSNDGLKKHSSTYIAGDTITVKKDKWLQYFDLTAMFGSDDQIAAALGINVADIATDAGVAAFEEWLATNLGKRDYYPYNAGTIINNGATGIKTIGFNRYNHETGKAYLCGSYSDYPYEYEISGTFESISYTDINGNTYVPELTDGRFFNVENAGELTVVGGSTDTLVHLVWSGWRNSDTPDGGYEAYWESVLQLNLKTLTGKLNGTGESSVIFPHGLAKVGDVQDEIINSTTAIKRIGVVDMGTLAWMVETSPKSGNVRFVGIVTNKKTGYNNIIVSKYVNDLAPINYGSTYIDKTISGYSSINRVYVLDSAITATTQANVAAAMSGVLLYYELETPEVYALDKEMDMNYRVDDFGTEEAMPAYTDEINAPLAYDVQYAMNAVDSIRRLPENYVQRKNVKQVSGSSETDVLSQKGVDDNYAKKRGVEDELVVGAAKAIAGNHRQVKEFTSMIIDGADGIAKINEGMGKSLVWNQMVKYNFSSNATNGITFSSDVTTQTIRMNGTATSTYASSQYVIGSVLIVGHKYLFKYVVVAGQMNGTMKFGLLNQSSVNSTNNSFSKVFTAAAIGKSIGLEVLTVNTAYDITVKTILIDLTLMFGAGNEPATVEDFEKLFNKSYYAYNAGEIISNKTEKLGVTGFNQWDEEWEQGAINAQGEETQSTTQIRPKNYVKCLGSTTYHFTVASFTNSYYLKVYWFDENKELISGDWAANQNIVSPVNAKFFRFTTNASTYVYGGTYNHDICINISDPDRNGTYEPYKHNDVVLNLATITGKAAGSEESVVIFPDGMRSAGSVYDSLVVDEDGYARKAIVRVGKVMLGELSWIQNENWGSATRMFATDSNLPNSKGAVDSATKANIICSKYRTNTRNKLYDGEDGINLLPQPKFIQIVDPASYTKTAEQFKTALTEENVELIFELATPIEYTLDTPILMTFMAYKGGTIIQSPQAPLSAPMKMNVTFALDAVGILTNLPEDYDTTASLDALCASLASTLSTALNGTLTITRGAYDATNKKYAFAVSFTPNT